jgi:hypothetical protein
MKKMILFLVFFLGVNLASLTAQEEVNYIIVKSPEGEVTFFNPSVVDRMYIESGNWVIELKESSQQYSYSVGDVFFAIEKRNATDADPVVQTSWNVYDDGNNLIITNLNGEIGSYTVYDLYGRTVETGYESGSKAVINVPAGNIYIVKADGKSKKVVKK